MSKIVDQLKNWGCDTDGAMERVLGNEELYIDLLHKVLEDSSFPDLGAALKNGDLKTAFCNAHQIKGFLGNMGLTPMYNISCLIVEPLRNESVEGVAEQYQTLMQLREQLESIVTS